MSVDDPLIVNPFAEPNSSFMLLPLGPLFGCWALNVWKAWYWAFSSAAYCAGLALPPHWLPWFGSFQLS